MSSTGKPRWINFRPSLYTSFLLYSLYFLCIAQRRQWHPTPVLLPGKSHGRSLVGCSPWGRWELDTTQWLHFHISLSYIGEGNGNPLQCSCLENPRDGGAGGLLSMGSHRVGQDWSNLAAAAAAACTASKLWTVSSIILSFMLHKYPLNWVYYYDHHFPIVNTQKV